MTHRQFFNRCYRALAIFIGMKILESWLQFLESKSLRQRTKTKKCGAIVLQKQAFFFKTHFFSGFLTLSKDSLTPAFSLFFLSHYCLSHIRFHCDVSLFNSFLLTLSTLLSQLTIFEARLHQGLSLSCCAFIWRPTLVQSFSLNDEKDTARANNHTN